MCIFCMAINKTQHFLSHLPQIIFEDVSYSDSKKVHKSVYYVFLPNNNVDHMNYIWAKMTKMYENALVNQNHVQNIGRFMLNDCSQVANMLGRLNCNHNLTKCTENKASENKNRCNKITMKNFIITVWLIC